MNSFESYSQQQIWDMLPLSVEQRKLIIKDFIEKDLYDKIPEKRVKFEDMKTKEELEEEDKKEKLK
jgi:hypothetical protein